MSCIHYLKLVPEGWLSLFQPLVPGAAFIAVVRPELFPLLARYETSIPTGPSAGRIYRRHEWLFVVGDDPEDPKFQLHVRYRILMVGDVPAPPAADPEPLDELLAMAAAGRATRHGCSAGAVTRSLPGIGSHHSARRITDEWLTPPHVLQALGSFDLDLDPCSPVERPWPTAGRHLTVEDDGLTAEWEPGERVWLNPPYSTLEPWMRRLAAHGSGTALLFARTETRWFFTHVWREATALLFLEGRLTFHRLDGTSSPAGHNSGGPSVLVAYGPRDRDALLGSGLPGSFVDEWSA